MPSALYLSEVKPDDEVRLYVSNPEADLPIYIRIIYPNDGYKNVQFWFSSVAAPTQETEESPDS